MKLEYESWCEKNAKAPDRYSYVYMVSDAKMMIIKEMQFLI